MTQQAYQLLKTTDNEEHLVRIPSISEKSDQIYQKILTEGLEYIKNLRTSTKSPFDSHFENPQTPRSYTQETKHLVQETQIKPQKTTTKPHNQQLNKSSYSCSSYDKITIKREVDATCNKIYNEVINNKKR